jgi:hypothetical protein
MKRIFLFIILATMFVGTAQAGGYGYGYGYGRGYNNGWAYGGAFLGGAIVGGLLARPYYYAPPPVYYAPPTYYAPPPVYYEAPAQPPIIIDQGTASEAPQGYRWTNVWDKNCNCNRAVLVPN